MIEYKYTSKKNYGKIEYYTGISYSPTDSDKDIARNIIRRTNGHKINHNSNWMKYKKILFKRVGCIEKGFKNKEQAEIREKEIKNKTHDSKQSLLNNFYSNYPYLAKWLNKYFSYYGGYYY